VLVVGGITKVKNAGKPCWLFKIYEEPKFLIIAGRAKIRAGFGGSTEVSRFNSRMLRLSVLDDICVAVGGGNAVCGLRG
jgi:hypothetical protein